MRTSRPLAGRSNSSGLDELLEHNRQWAEAVKAEDPQFFARLAKQQLPQYFWIGCADSRVPANQILGLAPGEVFVQRNVGNMATHKDMNCMACLEYAVEALKVRHIIVTGHYNCGAVRAALSWPARTPGLVNCWISDIRDTRNRHQQVLRALDAESQVDRLCELNVIRQVFNVCTAPCVQAAWDRGQKFAVHGFIYSVENGLLKELVKPIYGVADFARVTANGCEQRTMSFLTSTLVDSVATHMSFENAGAEPASSPAEGKLSKLGGASPGSSAGAPAAPCACCGQEEHAEEKPMDQ